jgi:hypothetical protein
VKAFWIAPLFIFIFLLTKVDRLFFKANHSFCLHYIDVPPTGQSLKTEAAFPAPLLDQPFSYLGKGSQSYVFESQDQNYVLKFYRFPSRMRRFSWLCYPFGYLFSPKRISLEKQRNQAKVTRSYTSYWLAYEHLQPETGVVYVHLHPTAHLQKKIHLKDLMGHSYQIPADTIGFILQRKGTPFLPLLKKALKQGQIETAQQMIDSLFQMIISRCSKGIIDRDTMQYDNYGWSEGSAMHLDIGRFTQKEEVKNSSFHKQEVVRVSSPLAKFLEKNSPELFLYYQQKVAEL